MGFWAERAPGHHQLLPKKSPSPDPPTPHKTMSLYTHNNEMKSPLLDPLEDPPEEEEKLMTGTQPSRSMSMKKKLYFLVVILLFAGCGIFYEVCIPHGPPPADPGPIHYDNSTDDDVDNR